MRAVSGYIPEIECAECWGNGVEVTPSGLTDTTCPACDGEGWRPMNDDELDRAAEEQAERHMSEPPMSLDEQHRRAWEQKQELRR